MCEATKLPIDARVIAIDETGHYTFPAEHQPYIEKILAVYLYDANERTHLCELTASHYLRFLHHVVHFTESGDYLPDDDEMREELRTDYEVENFNEDCYMHCADLERLEKAGTPENYYTYGATEIPYEDSDYDDQIEGLIEHFNGNPPF